MSEFVPSPSKIVSHDKRKADRSNLPPKKARQLEFVRNVVKWKMRIFADRRT
jgi:hypothetical protein